MIFSNCIIDGCDNPVENKDTGLCATHSAEQRKSERDSKKVKVVRPVKKVSEKRAEESKEYNKLVKEFLEYKLICEMQLEGCTQKATEIHHLRGRIGKNYLDTNTFMAVCHSCHSYNHDRLSAEERRRLGFML